MNNIQLSITAGLFGLLLLVNQLAGARQDCAHCLGGLPWYGWGGGLAVIFGAGLISSRRGGERLRQLMARPARTRPAAAATPAGAGPAPPAADKKWNEELRRKYDWDGPDYPHPVIITERCIGCHACVESCPHDVLTIINGTAAVADHDLCMEDTTCESVCPVTPKACIVVNTTKRIKSVRAPWRNHVYMSSVSGCHIIGDVSGTPLIKNAVNEGKDVIVHLANELRAERDRGAGAHDAEYDVAIIGAGPAGLSAAVTAKRLGLKFICIERDTVMSTIERAYSANKYVYFKPETMEWAGGIHLPGLEEYVEEVLEEFLDGPHKSRAADLLAKERAGGLDQAGRDALDAARQRYQQLLDAELRGEIDEGQRAPLAQARRKFAALLEEEERYILARLIKEEAEAQGRGADLSTADRARLDWARHNHGDQLEAYLAALSYTEERFLTLAQERRKVAGDQREVLLNTWRMNARENGIRVHEKESCTSVERAEDGDCFVIQTKREEAQDAPSKPGEGRGSYRARRVVLAIGKSSSPAKLPVKDVPAKVRHRHTGREFDKVLYRLSDPAAFTGLNLIVVGGGNSAVEAAVALVSWRRGDKIIFRTGPERNEVTMLVRSSDFKTDVKFGNKQQLYQCVEAGLIKVCRNTEIVRVSDAEVVTVDLVSGRENPPMPNDFIFAFIGSEPKAALLNQMGITMVE